MTRAIDISGERYGRLVAVSLAASNPRRWLCRCDCGRAPTIDQAAIRTGNTASCGCLRVEVTSERNVRTRTTHGYRGTRTYTSWHSMKNRCLNPKAHAYERYGGAGITVCERWMKFENFLSDMGERPEGKSLDRIDNAKGYEPANCRWATRSEQSKNRRSHGGKPFA